MVFVLNRKTDPATSSQAASRTDLSAAQSIFVFALMKLGQATAQEVAVTAVRDYSARQQPETIRKRAKELQQMQPPKIRAVGVRACRVTGNRATVFEVCK